MIFRLNIDKDCTEEIVANVHERTQLIDEIERLVSRESITDKLPGYVDDEIIMLSINEVECFYVENEKTIAVYSGGKQYIVKKRLYELEEVLNDDFVRFSKSSIGNIKKIVKFKVQFSGAVDAVLKSGHIEAISRRCFVEIRRRFGI